ncbi:sulfite exporter TauE/SafE family protein [Dialister succinatiphilus]|uniref:sulfite exporter TauE/SafE family protein n=1 Tax=Dialister succinatiphilus TaxID=487173 RepID=UPI003AB3C983
MDILLQYLIICPLVMVAGFVDAIAGGGGLISLPAYLISGLPVHNAIATNKMSSTMGTVLATFKFARSGFIPWKLALTCVCFAFAGSSLGARLALLMDSHIFLLFMVVVLPLTAIYVTRGKALIVEKEPYTYKKTAVLSILMALLIGVYDGFYGPGTGTFLLLLLTGVAHLPLKEANGVTKVINSTTNIAALCVFLLNGKVLFPLGPIAGLFGMAGNYLGALYFAKGGGKNVKPVIMTVLTIFFLKVLYELL